MEKIDERNCISKYSQIKAAIPNTFVSTLKKKGKFSRNEILENKTS
jgi:hypothetical protein